MRGRVVAVPQITVRWPFGVSVAEMVRCASAQLCPPLAQRTWPWIAIPKSRGRLSATRFWNNGYGYACSQCAQSGLLKGLLENLPLTEERLPLFGERVQVH